MRFDHPKEENTTVSVVIHNVNILDASGSMGHMFGNQYYPSKYDNALKGINAEIEGFKEGSDGNTFTQTFVEFASDGMGLGQLTLITHYFMTPAGNCKAVIGRGANGGTPLYQTVGETIEKLMANVKKGEKVIIKIFTDGDENSSQGKYAPTSPFRSKSSPELTKLIKLVENNYNFTVTFMGTQADVSSVIHNVGILESNTLVHDNTPMGVSNSYMVASSATRSYSKLSSEGASTDELKGKFFKRIIDQEEQSNKGLSK